MPDRLKQEISAFLESKRQRHARAGQTAALQIACHFDLGEALAAGPEARRRIVLRLERTIERERLRGVRRHWSYDLNRHIALKQALDSLRSHGDAGTDGGRRPKQNGARRRRWKSD